MCMCCARMYKLYCTQQKCTYFRVKVCSMFYVWNGAVGSVCVCGGAKQGFHLYYFVYYGRIEYMLLIWGQDTSIIRIYTYYNNAVFIFEQISSVEFAIALFQPRGFFCSFYLISTFLRLQLAAVDFQGGRRSFQIHKIKSIYSLRCNRATSRQKCFVLFVCLEKVQSPLSWQAGAWAQSIRIIRSCTFRRTFVGQ